MRHVRYLDRAAFEGERLHVNDTVAGGIAAGLLAGAAMLAWAVGSALLADIPPARPLELTGATIVGGDEMSDGPHVVLLGAILWAVVSTALGLLFASLLPRNHTFVSAAILGVGYSFFVLGLMATVVLPRVNPAMRAEMSETGGSWVLAYIAFGVFLGFVPRFRRHVAERAARHV